MCYRSKKEKSKTAATEKAMTVTEAPNPNGQGSVSGLGGTTQYVRNQEVAELIRAQTTVGKLLWKRTNDVGTYERTYTATFGEYELTATADHVSFRNIFTGVNVGLNVSGILSTIEKARVPDPVGEFQNALAVL